MSLGYEAALYPIASVDELALFLKVDVDTATGNLLLLDLAQGLISAEIGFHDPWPTVAKSVALSAAGRAYVNPEGLKRETTGGTTSERNAEEMGVYLTDSELTRLHRWLNGPGGATSGKPQGSFPPARAWPDPAGRC